MAAGLARWEARLRPWLVRLPPRLAVRVYSAGRRSFLAQLESSRPRPAQVPTELANTLWGLTFRAPLLNAAGMFKTGGGYGLVAAQGAGGYLAGTSTGRARRGNRKRRQRQPFAPYPRSGAASNWLGLPNPGHGAVARRLAGLTRVAGCPVGASLASVPEDADTETARMALLLEGLRAYERAGVDFLELNESCPNTEDAASGAADLAALDDRLRQLARGFLRTRARRLPLIVKLSNDTAVSLVPKLIDLLLEHGVDGVNFGNTSIDYDRHRRAIAEAERPLFDHFVRRFGGGVSGRPLRPDAQALCRAARAHLDGRGTPHEFHVVSTGGIEHPRDVEQARAAGASLCQWYTGYFEALARDGHDLYGQCYSALVSSR